LSEIDFVHFLTVDSGYSCSFSAALRRACNARISPALDVSVAIGTTSRSVPALDSL
jgi:hypothetical protein